MVSQPVHGTKQALIAYVIELILELTARTAGAPAMVQALADVMFQAKLERACIDCRLYAETGNPQSLLYVEQWSTTQDLETQLQSQRFGMLLAIMETASRAPHLEVRTVSDQRGLDYISSVRLASPGMASAEGRYPTANSTSQCHQAQPPGTNPSKRTT